MPPLIVTVAEPVAAPLHPTSVCEVVKAKAGACVMVTLDIVIQPLASVTAQSYVPAGKLFIVAVVPPLLHK